MSKVFISHRKSDADLAKKLAKEIADSGHQVWFDEWEIDVGDSIVARIDTGLKDSSYLILCLGDSGLSYWVDREWMSTLARQMGGARVKILPALLSSKAELPAILSDLRYANLGGDWGSGLADLIKAIK